MKLTNKISYCWTDEEGLTMEFATLREAVNEAKKYTKEHEDFQTCIFALSSIHIENGKIID